ncbi:EFR1 family ferrodoxin [Pseudobacteroides cellulosolvens]|uniref:4Fe-4S ferredoxin iron-sulfur binding domain-containing protein n=1 Tax=Pseudobacteroides cellulosolvens ATCC 35603 = DSM 2933 TaxID=398512 RepID=A0A0L6JVE6_9FIRM|nr:EFR1 family ferrodoxin [Pseudobacteroides cellulosolvens]KNY29402.1 4Fe-4S ferredoxin iron-sulfur binding domain-containing protein [Pseudobacteroides cellulosolvens ATCC 35603 = DSM 2933]
MSRALVLYFSGTNNTKYIAEMFKKCFENRNIQTDVYDILKYNEDNNIKYDYLVAGSPIYIELYPKIFIDNIKGKIDKSTKIKSIFFATQAAKSLTPSFNEVCNYFKNTEVEITQTDFFRMPNNFYNFLFTKTPISQYETLRNNATEKVELIVDKFLSGDRNIMKVSNIRYYLTKITYILCSKFYIPAVARKVSINKEKCVKCRICEKNCPTNSLKIDNKPPISKGCTMCQKCMNNCPENAFIYKDREIDIYEPIESN